MNEKLRTDIRSGVILAALVGSDGKIVWQTPKSPVGMLMRAYFAHELDEDALKGGALYTNQFGVALALFAQRTGIVRCVATKLSDPGHKKIEEEGIKIAYDERINLVHSSKNPDNVCPIEAALVAAASDAERWRFLEGRFGGQ